MAVGNDMGRAGGEGPIDRLIDQGLERYGKGDLDGAIDSWQRVLSMVPNEARAAGYIAYVRSHYELLRGGGGAAASSELAVPFGLDELDADAAYEIEISGDVQRVRVEAYIEQVDDGWFLDEAVALPPPVTRALPLPANPVAPAPSLELELEAEEPDTDAEGAVSDAARLVFGAPGAAVAAPGPRARTGDDDQTRDFGPEREARAAGVAVPDDEFADAS